MYKYGRLDTTYTTTYERWRRTHDDSKISKYAKEKEVYEDLHRYLVDLGETVLIEYRSGCVWKKRSETPWGSLLSL
jgi:hypothetical protein